MDSLKRNRTSENEERAGKSTFQCDEFFGTEQTMNPVEFHKEYENVNYEKSVQVIALQKAASWQPLSDNQIGNIVMRVGSCFPPLSIDCFDKNNNRVQFPSSFKLRMLLKSSTYAKGFSIDLSSDIVLSSDRRTMKIKDVRVSCSELDKIKPNYNATMHIVLTSDQPLIIIKDVQVSYSELDKIRPSYNATMGLIPIDELFSVTIPFQVFPGAPRRVLLKSTSFLKKLVPGETIEGMVLEVFDEYGNHVQENELISIQLDGLCIQDGRSLTFKANKYGDVDLSGLLRVVKGFGQRGSFSVFSDDQKIFEKSFQTEVRELRTAFQIPFFTTVGRRLENIAFEVIKANGEVDEGIHGEGENGGSHTLTVISDLFELGSPLKYSFIHGRCTVQEIPLPRKEGKFYIRATHSHHPELHLNLELHRLNPKHTPGQILNDLSTDMLQTVSSIRQLEKNTEPLIRQQSILEEKIATLQECLNHPKVVPGQQIVKQRTAFKIRGVKLHLPDCPKEFRLPGEFIFPTQIEANKKELRVVNDMLARERAEREGALNTSKKQDRMYNSLLAYIASSPQFDQIQLRNLVYIEKAHWLG